MVRVRASFLPATFKLLNEVLHIHYYFWWCYEFQHKYFGVFIRIFLLIHLIDWWERVHGKFSVLDGTCSKYWCWFSHLMTSFLMLELTIQNKLPITAFVPVPGRSHSLECIKSLFITWLAAVSLLPPPFAMHTQPVSVMYSQSNGASSSHIFYYLIPI